MRKKYTVIYRAPFASNWSHGQHNTLATALITSWRKRHRDYSVDRISYQEKIVINQQELMTAFQEMDALARDQPGLPIYEIAELVIRRMAKDQFPPTQGKRKAGKQESVGPGLSGL